LAAALQGYLDDANDTPQQEQNSTSGKNFLVIIYLVHNLKYSVLSSYTKPITTTFCVTTAAAAAARAARASTTASAGIPAAGIPTATTTTTTTTTARTAAATKRIG
jgi:hypothetical protein